MSDADRRRRPRPAGKKASTDRFLRSVDPESARLVALLRGGEVVGAGCLIDSNRVLTCAHVVRVALGMEIDSREPIAPESPLEVRLSTADGPWNVAARFERASDSEGLAGDLALIRLEPPTRPRLHVAAAEFATPFRHGGKAYSVFGFPEGNPDGYYASGVLQGMNTAGLIQLDNDSPIRVEGGFSGAPVWSSDVKAFVGLVVSELADRKLAWCIPSRALARFVPDLPVRFRMTAVDRPDVHDYDEDDPNIPLFGTTSETDVRRLSITGIEEDEEDEDEEGYVVNIRYECLNGVKPRGRFVTFVTHPSFAHEDEDSYELFSELIDGVAETWFVAKGPFTVAAIGDAGDTALTCDIAASRHCPEEWRSSGDER